MSRRLGDDPLSRQRKNNSKNRRVGGKDHSASGVPAAPNYPISAQPHLHPESIDQVPSSTPASLSYNDVFFRRRSDDKVEQMDRITENGIGTKTAAGPVAPLSAVAEPSPRYQAPSVPLAMSVPTPTPNAATGSPQSQPEKAVASVSPAPMLTEIDQELHLEAQSGQPKVQEGGFLRRILGRLRK